MRQLWEGSRYPYGLITGQQALGTLMGCSMGQMQVGSRYPSGLITGYLKPLILIGRSTGQEVGGDSGYPNGQVKETDGRF